MNLGVASDSIKNVQSVLVIGAGGFIGTRLYKTLLASFPHGSVFGSYYSSENSRGAVKLDIRNGVEIRNLIYKLKPSMVVIVAGTKDVSRCEKDSDYAYALNTQPVSEIVSIIERNNLPTKVILISSDYVFDGKAGCYSDTDDPVPVTVYGQSKYAAENLLLESSVDAKVARLSAVMGKDAGFYRWFVSSMNERKTVALYKDAFFTPTPISLVVAGLCQLIINYEEIPQKTVHVVGRQSMSRFQFGMEWLKNNPSSKGIVVGEKLDNHTLIQPDLSMRQSSFVSDIDSMSLFQQLDL